MCYCVNCQNFSWKYIKFFSSKNISGRRNTRFSSYNYNYRQIYEGDFWHKHHTQQISFHEKRSKFEAVPEIRTEHFHNSPNFLVFLKLSQKLTCDENFLSNVAMTVQIFYLMNIDYLFLTSFIFASISRICWTSHWIPSCSPSPDSALDELMCHGFSFNFSKPKAVRKFTKIS